MAAAPAAADSNTYKLGYKEMPKLELGGVFGGHWFSVNNELGVIDAPDTQGVRDSVLFGIRVGHFFHDILGVELEAGVIPTEGGIGTPAVWALTYRAQLVAQFGANKPEHKWIPFVLGGVGATTVVSTENESVVMKDTDEMLFFGPGVKYRLSEKWGARLDARVLFPPSSETEFAAVDYELLVGIYHEFGKGKLNVEKVLPPPDTDGDGIIDDNDDCKDDPEDFDDFEDTDGCPEPDNDKDGVLDAAPDQCMLDPEDPDKWQDEDGCPEDDNDGDGIKDPDDLCPNDKEDVDQFEDTDGCPEEDNDKDGILDPVDACPIEPETPNGFKDQDGCADEVPKALKEFTGVIKGITFETKSAVIKKSSNKTLDAAAKILIEYVDTKLEIQGHTDDVGEDAFNMDLSQKRAESVKAYLVKKGVAEDRLIANGFGETVPVDPKTTKAARAKNRRVEFRLITTATTPPPPAEEPPPVEEPAPEPTPEPK